MSLKTWKELKFNHVDLKEGEGEKFPLALHCVKKKKKTQ